MKLALAGLTLFVLTVLSGCISRDLRALDDRGDESTRVLVIAHRGASAYAPENTFAAFDKARELGAIATETDIQLSKDGKLVIFHDDTLDKKTNLKGPVRSHTWAELEDVDMAPWFAKEAATTADAVKTDVAQTPSRAAMSGTASTTPSKKAGAGIVKRSTKKNARKTKTPDIMGEIMRAKTLGFNEISVRASIVTHDHVKLGKRWVRRRHSRRSTPSSSTITFTPAAIAEDPSIRSRTTPAEFAD